MKLSRSILLVLAGVLIAGALFSFRETTNQIETIIVKQYTNIVIVTYPDGIEKDFKFKTSEFNGGYNKLINDFGKEGWEIKGVYALGNTAHWVYLQRPKQ